MFQYPCRPVTSHWLAVLDYVLASLRSSGKPLALCFELLNDLLGSSMFQLKFRGTVDRLGSMLFQLPVKSVTLHWQAVPDHVLASLHSFGMLPDAFKETDLHTAHVACEVPA